MDEQDRQDGNYLVLVSDLSSTRKVAQNSPTIVDWKKTCTPSCLSCSSMLVSLAKTRSVISRNGTAPMTRVDSEIVRFVRSCILLSP